MSDLIHLQDIDNRGPDGESWETTGTAEQIIGYLTGPLWSDITPTARLDLREDLDVAVQALREGGIDAAAAITGPKFGVYLAVVPGHPFRPVAGHPDDDECTYTDGGIYCGAPEAAHEWSER